MDTYTIEVHQASLSVDHFISTYRDAHRVESYCSGCHNYGRNWSCPPFRYDVEQRLRAYERVLIIAMKATPSQESVSWQELEQLLIPERLHLEARLRDTESQHDALACYPGSCLYCNDNHITSPRTTTHCTRCNGTPCLHPHLMRPSLEAYGFDLVKTMEHIFNLPLQWHTPGTTPQYSIYIAAIFHNSDTVEW